jgi:anti-anti-sigma factor
VHSHFRAELSVHGDLAVVTLSGELDLASSPALAEELERLATSGPTRVVLDLRELEFMDSTGLSTLAVAQAQLKQNGQRLTVVRGTAQVQRLLELTGVADRLELVDDPGGPELSAGA